MTDPIRDRWFLGTLMRFHVTSKDSAGALSVIEQRAPAGFSPPLHMHTHEDAILYVLEGELTVVVGDTSRRVGAMQCAYLPRGVPHTFRVERESRLIEVTTPGGADEFYAENGVPAEALTLPAPSAPDIERLHATAHARAIALVGPPLTH